MRMRRPRPHKHRSLHLTRPRVLQKLHGLFIHGEDDAPGLADDAVVGAGGVDAEGAGADDAVLIALAVQEAEATEARLVELPAALVLSGKAKGS